MEEPAAPEAAEEAGPELDGPAVEEEPAPEEGGRKKAITGKYNSSPVGDIEMSKVKGTYNTYKLQLSMGQIEVIMNALEANHADPVSDELLATFQYYIKELPGPGEDEEEFEAQKKALENPGGAGEEEAIPMPPGGKVGTPPAGAEEEATFMPEEEPGAAEPEEPAAMGAPTGEPGLPEPEAAAPEPPPESGNEADRHLPKPPRE